VLHGFSQHINLILHTCGYMLLQVASSPNFAAALPEALTAQILQHVPQQQRLQQCALACKSWATAAALATVHVEQELQVQSQAIPSLERWLQKYAGHLESLQLSHSRRGSDVDYELQLPWSKLAKLQRLQLEFFKLQLPGEGDKLQLPGEGDKQQLQHPSMR
jgi:hypothetical protein